MNRRQAIKRRQLIRRKGRRVVRIGYWHVEIAKKLGISIESYARAYIRAGGKSR